MEEFEAETAEDERGYLLQRSLGNLPIRMNTTLTDFVKETVGDVDEDESNQIVEERNIYFDYE